MYRCPICGKEKNLLLAKRVNISPYQNKLFTDMQDAIHIKKVDMEIYLCQNCTFVFNPTFDESIDLYDGDYNNDQNVSAFFERYIEESIRYMQRKYLKKPTKILEIGCGKNAHYLRKLAETFPHAQCEGYDPSCTIAQEDGCKNVLLHNQYFDLNQINESSIDLLVCRHVIEHIKKPLDLLKNIKSLNKNHEKTVAFFETPDVNWILKNNVVFDFTYEHCSFFSPCSITMAAGELDLEMQEVVSAFQGQYMWSFASNKKKIEKNITELKEAVLNNAEKYIKNEIIILEAYQNLIKQKQKEGSAALWGAGGKGNLFLNMFDPQKKYIQHVFDLNVQKEGMFIAGTGHRIENPNTGFSDEIRNLFIMNRNYEMEIKEWLYARNKKVNIVVLDNINF